VITTIRNLSLTGQQVRQADGEPYLADAGRIEHDVLQRPAVARLRRGKSGCDRVLRGARQGGERVAQLEPADEGRACHQQHKRNKKTADPPSGSVASWWKRAGAQSGSPRHRRTRCRARDPDRRRTLIRSEIPIDIGWIECVARSDQKCIAGRTAARRAGSSRHRAPCPSHETRADSIWPRKLTASSYAELRD
jgi:hypothetical protein